MSSATNIRSVGGFSVLYFGMPSWYQNILLNKIAYKMLLKNVTFGRMWYQPCRRLQIFVPLGAFSYFVLECHPGAKTSFSTKLQCLLLRLVTMHRMKKKTISNPALITNLDLARAPTMHDASYDMKTTLGTQEHTIPVPGFSFVDRHHLVDDQSLAAKAPG